MNTEKPLNPRILPRCHVCRLPPDLRRQVHQDRFEFHVTLEELARKLRDAGHSVSESAIRRHLQRHLPAESYSQFDASTVGTPAASDVPTVFDDLVGKPVDDRAVLEAATSAVIGKMRAIEAECQGAVGRHPQAAERALAKFLKTMGVLERSLKSLQEARKPHEERKKVLGTLLVEMGRAAAGACRDFMKDNVSTVRVDVNEYLVGRLRPTHLSDRLKWFEEDWPTRLKDRVTDAIKDALKESKDLREWL